MNVPGRVRTETLSPALARDWNVLAPTSERSVERRLGWVWGLLMVDVLTYYKVPTNLVPLPSSVGKIITESALAVALVLVVTINRRLLVRPNILLVLLTVLCATSAMMSLRGYFGFGSMLRCVRFIVFVGVLWLTTSWWGRADLLICRYYKRAITIVLVTVVVGLAIAPGRALAYGGGGRLGGVIWPIAGTQVADYAALLVGLTVVMWLAEVPSRWTLPVIVGGLAILLLTHTRTAFVALLVGTMVAGLSLFLTRRRVRRAFAVVAVVGALGALSFAPAVTGWFDRGESAQQLSSLTGRTDVWGAVLSAPRTEVNTIFGYGMSNDSFQGLSIDSSWLSTYLDQGLFGDVIDGLVLVSVLGVALLRPRGPGRAIALFLVVYCAISSFTETGLGQPSTYVLDLAVAMSVLMPPLVTSPAAISPSER